MRNRMSEQLTTDRVLRVLFVDIQDGPAVWADVAKAMASSIGSHDSPRIEIDSFSPNPLPTLLPSALAGDALVKLEQDLSFGEPADLVVAAGVSAGPAAHLGVQARARRVVLISPDMASAAIDISAIATLIPFDEEGARERLERLQPFEDEIENGVFSDDVIDILVGAYTGDPIRRRQADITKATYRARAPFDRGLGDPSGRGEDAANWVKCWSDSPAIDLWLTKGALHKAGCSRAGLMFGASIPG
jgi:hypothetical protein